MAFLTILIANSIDFISVVVFICCVLGIPLSMLVMQESFKLGLALFSGCLISILLVYSLAAYVDKYNISSAGIASKITGVSIQDEDFGDSASLTAGRSCPTGCATPSGGAFCFGDNCP